MQAIASVSLEVQGIPSYRRICCAEKGPLAFVAVTISISLSDSLDNIALPRRAKSGISQAVPGKHEMFFRWSGHGEPILDTN